MSGTGRLCRLVVPIALIGAMGVAAVADSNIADPKKWAWCENVGWTNWADANGRMDGVEVYRTDATTQYLKGWIWAENIGWIHVGDGSAPYANTDDTDYGINIDPGTGLMTGYAWAENVGWLNFGPFGSSTAPPATWDHANHRSRGYVWGENIGWMNIDDMLRHICAIPGDLDADGDVDVFDFGQFAPNFGTFGHRSFTNGDCDGDGDVDVFDFGLFAPNFGRVCP